MEDTNSTEQTTKSEQCEHTNSYPSDRLALMRVYDPHEIPLHLWQDSMDTYLSGNVLQNIYNRLGAVLQNQDNVQLYKYVDIDKGTEKPEGVLWLVFDYIMDSIVCPFISVQPDYRGQNIVGRSLQFAEELARQCGLSRIVGTTNYPKWVECWGFEDTGQKTVIKEVE